jgi:CspA family cold shock protein
MTPARPDQPRRQGAFFEGRFALVSGGDPRGGGAKAKGLSDMAKGVVKWFNTEKGYGFIQPDDGGKDIFVHITAVQAAGLQSLQDNQPVEYQLVDGRDGRKSAGDLKT